MSMTFYNFSKANYNRCVSPIGFNHPLEAWSRSDWITAALGELGEAANIVKKLNRVRDGIPGNKESEIELKSKLKAEIADTVTYLDLFCQSQGFDLEDALIDTFHAVSKRIGYPEKME